MANLQTNLPSLTFSDFPEDVQLCILSFLTPSELTSFSCTSKRFSSLCLTDSKLWFCMCDRKWGSKTHIKKWGNGKIQFKLLYKTLNRWENLIGFWRRTGAAGAAQPPLVYFEWGASFITGSRVSPSKNGTYKVVKTPFLWMGVSELGEAVNFLDPDCKFGGSSSDFVKAAELGAGLDSDLVSVNVSFMGRNHMVVEQNQNFEGGRKISFKEVGVEEAGVRIEENGGVEEGTGMEGTSPGSVPDHCMLEIYQYFANRTSPGGDRASRRQRRRERERLGRRKWAPEHFMKIVNCAPVPSRPLQGLWKGICDDMSLDFYLVAYDDIGGIACRRVGDASEPFSGYSPIFWASNTMFIEAPFSSEEEYLYDSRIHLQPLDGANHNHQPLIENEVVSCILNINSSYDLVIPDFSGSSGNPRCAEGRIWLYVNGTFGFGFLRNNFITDLKHIAFGGCLLDTV